MSKNTLKCRQIAQQRQDTFFGKVIFGGLMGHFRGENGHFRRLLHLKMPQKCLKNAKNG